MRPTRVLFVNGGILGLISFYGFLREWLTAQSSLVGEHVVLTERLTPLERTVRRVMCQRLWRDGWLGLKNLDLARFRHELHAGLLARKRMASLGVERFDALHFHRQATAYGSLDLMRAIPSIVTMDCTQQCVLDSATSALERKTYAPNLRLDGEVFRRAAHIVATSRWAAASLHRLYPWCDTPVHVMPDPVVFRWFDANWLEERRTRGLRGARPRVLFMGGDFPRKGGYDLLAAWRAGAFHLRADLDVVTSWPIETPLPPGVTLFRTIVPHSVEWAERWKAADIFVLPTRNEAFGLVFQEAAAAGLPAIGSRLNAVPEIVLDGETGVLIPPGDLDALVRALELLIASADIRAKLGRRAREVIEQVAAPDAYLARLTAIIQVATRKHEGERGVLGRAERSGRKGPA